MLKCLTILLLLFSTAYAQMVTSSFDRSTLSRNPAGSAFRGYSQMAVFHEMRNIDSQDDGTGSAGVDFEEELKINKTGIYFTGHGKFTPELYLSRDVGERTLKVSSFQDQSADATLINNVLNLGFLLTKRFAIGFKFYKPNYTYKDKVQFNDSGGANVVNTDNKTSITGIGAGLTFQLTNALFFGGFYVKESQSTKSENTFVSGGVTDDNSGHFDDNLSYYGFGLGLLRGGRGNGFHAEASYSRKEYSEQIDQPAGEEIAGTIEYSGWATAGLNVKLRKNGYYEHLDLMNVIVGEQVFSDSYEPLFGGFFSFGKGKGHTFGLSGLVYNSSGKRDFFGTGSDIEVKSKTTTLSANYAYLF